jgi:sigma-B regulation protein RsbU (phosphoserine phosphatase)
VALRHRILLILGLGLALLAAALAWTAAQRDRIVEARISDLAVLGQRALWDERARLAVEGMAPLVDAVTASEPLRSSLAIGHRNIVASTVGGQLGHVLAGADVFEITAPDGQPIYAAAARVGGERTLDLATLAEVAAGRQLTGLWQDGPDRFLIVRAFPLSPRPGETVVVTLGRDAAATLQGVSEALDAPAFLVNPRGRMVEGTDPALWATLAPDMPLRRASLSDLDRGGRKYTLVGVPVPDLGGGQAGLVVTARDATGPLGELERQRWLTVLGAGLGVAALLGGMFLYLGRAFRPLDRAIDVLDALADGDTGVRVDSEGSDEIGRIGAAVARLRRQLMTLADLRLQRDRQTRRQERLIRARMRSLAEALDPAARQEIVDILEQEAAVPSEGTHQDLALLTNVLHLLSRRITEQHRRLTDMIEELREAIVTRARLAGITQELEIARRVQAALLPSSFPPVPGFEVEAGMVPAREVGGDFYDFFEAAGGRYVLTVGDVSGKGVPAALFMAITRTLLRAAARYEPDPARCVAIVNDVLAGENEQLMFVTLFYATLDAAGQRLTYVNAGHNAPLLVGPGRAARYLHGSGDRAVAVTEGLEYHGREVTLAPGETLLVFTDGITEAFDPDDRPFGDERLRAAAAELNDGRGLAPMTRGILDRLAAFVRGAPQSDDITYLALRRTGGESGVNDFSN